MVLYLGNGKYLHTAYAISNIPELFEPSDWSTSSQEGMTYIGQYIDGIATDSDDPTKYNWNEFVDADVDDEDEKGIMPVADYQSQIDALQDQSTVLQTDAEDLQSSVEINESNLSGATEMAEAANDVANAINQHFWTDTHGAYVTEVTQEEWKDEEGGNYQSGSNSLWNSLGMLFRKGLNNLLAIFTGTNPGIAIYDGNGNNADNIIASFTAEGVTLGKENDTNLNMNYRSMKLVDRDGQTYFHISDLRNEEGYIEQEYTGDGSTATFPTLMEINRVESVTVDGLQKELSTDFWVDFNSVTFNETPLNGAVIIIIYEPTEPEQAKAYTVGVRDETATVGVSSFVEGVGSAASGPRSHAEGCGNVVTGEESHVEGTANTVNGKSSHCEGAWNNVSGNYAHAEGQETEAAGEWSHAEGWGTIANGNAQHVFGQFNTPDITSVEIVGYGSDRSNRDNIRTLDQNGKEWLKDTLHVSRDPVTPYEVATKNYVDNSGGGGGGTTNYNQLTNKPQINSVELSGNKSLSDLGITLTNLGGVPTTRTINGNALSSDITLDATDVGALPDTTVIPTKVSDLTNDSGFIPKDDLFFKPGDVYSVTYNHARALTGYVSSSTKGMYFEIPLPKFLTDVSSATITAMTGGVRGISGYVNGLTNNSNLKSGYTVTASVDNPNTLYVSVVSANTLSNVTNNTPISVALNSIRITFS